ncbi:MAG: 50S ribosomal protein L25 [Patescibacteria group bacterium]|jgi:large subunit ribosomal protein L25|nr:50S ribosomal protein L25 [Patescibacteria group bacterium]
MSNDTISISLEERKSIRKGLNTLRKEGLLPAVIHRPGKESLIVQGSTKELTSVYNEAGERHPVEVKVGSTTYLTLIKEVDLEPTKSVLRHLVFGAIKRNEKVETEVDIDFIDDSPAEKAGLIINQTTLTVEVKALPNDLPDKVEVSIESLIAIGDKLTLADIKPIEGVEILGDPELTIATVEEVQEQIVEEETTPAEAEAAALAEPEQPEPESK